jgi:hypothetical protein
MFMNIHGKKKISNFLIVHEFPWELSGMSMEEFLTRIVVEKLSDFFTRLVFEIISFKVFKKGYASK